MALEYRHQPRDAGTPADTVKIEQHWYLTEDKERVVPEGHPEARWLWATPDMEMPRVEAERLGAVKPVPADKGADDVGETVKEKPAPADKQRAKPGDKSTSKPASVAELRERAAELGVQVDNRWGVARLQQEITNAEGGD